jgi:hypothetical protein
MSYQSGSYETRKKHGRCKCSLGSRKNGIEETLHFPIVRGGGQKIEMKFCLFNITIGIDKSSGLRETILIVGHLSPNWFTRI